MLFIFANGHQVHSRIGSNVCGMIRGGKRPIDVMIGGKELLGFMKAVGTEEAVRYLIAQVGTTLIQVERD